MFTGVCGEREARKDSNYDTWMFLKNSRAAKAMRERVQSKDESQKFWWSSKFDQYLKLKMNQEWIIRTSKTYKFSTCQLVASLIVFRKDCKNEIVFCCHLVAPAKRLLFPTRTVPEANCKYLLHEFWQRGDKGLPKNCHPQNWRRRGLRRQR